MLKRFISQFEELQKSDLFLKWKKENDDSYLSGGFVIIEEIKNVNEFDWQIDFYSPSKKKVYTFAFQKGKIELKDPDKVFQVHQKDLNKLNIDNFKLSPHQVIELIKENQEKENNKIMPMKIICTMQNIDGKDIYNIIIITMQFSVLNAKVDASTGEIIKIAQQNIMEFGKMEPGNKKK